MDRTLYRIFANNMTREIVSLAGDGFDFNFCFSNGITPLVLAVMNGHRSAVRLLLRFGADISGCDASGSVDPLCTAILFGHQDIALFLIDSGAFLECDTYNKEFSLLFLSIERNLDIVTQALLDRDCRLGLRAIRKCLTPEFLDHSTFGLLHALSYGLKYDLPDSASFEFSTPPDHLYKLACIRTNEFISQKPSVLLHEIAQAIMRLVSDFYSQRKYNQFGVSCEFLFAICDSITYKLFDDE